MSASAARVVKREPLDPKDARWIRLNKITYADPTSHERVWESAERATRADSAGVDGVGIVAILELPTGPEILLQKQFRPPVNKVCIEVPAGLVDEGETPTTSALRELKEETGYVGKVLESGDGFGITPVMFNDPGFTNTNVVMIHVTVDMSLAENQNPKPELEPGEFIECFTIPVKDMYQEIRRLEKEGFAIDARVGTLAEGIEVAKRWKLV